MKKSLSLVLTVCSFCLLNGCSGATGSPPPPPAATHLSVMASSAAPVAGTPFNVTVTVLDASNNVVATYSGTVHFTSSDMQAVLPADSTLSNGSKTFSVTFKTAGNSQNIMVADTAGGLIAGNSALIGVSPAAASQFAVNAPTAATVGAGFDFTVTAQDAFKNTAIGYSGTVHFTSTGAQAVLPADSPLIPGVGTATFSAKFNNAGSPTITATDTASPLIAGTSNLINTTLPAPLEITSAPPPNGTAGVLYNNSYISASGGVQPYMFALATGSSPFPVGLTLTSSNGIGSNNVGLISGTPTLSGTTNNIIIQVSDSQSPPATAKMTYAITIAPPLPLNIVTMSPLPSAGVGIVYSTSVSAAGGVGPLTFTLTSGSSPLPAGLSLSAPSGSIFGIPTATGTTTNIIVQVADSQAVPATATMSYNLTIDPSTFYVGTQAPGDVWQMAISRASATSGVIGFQDQGPNGLIGPLAGNSQQFNTFPNGFMGLNFLRTEIEMPGNMMLFVPSVGARLVGHVPDRVVVAAANTCPQLPATRSYQFVALADEDFDLTKDAYGVAAVTQTAANSYNFAFNSFTLEGATGTSNTLPGLSCDSNLKVFLSTSASGVISTVAISASGLMVMDNGTGIPAVGVQRPPANLSPAAILDGQYLGTVFFANDRLRLVCSPHSFPPCIRASSPATDLVGFGPGSATSITGGTFLHIASDPFNAHDTKYGITLGTQASPGLFTGGTLTIGTRSLANFDAVVGQVNGKFVLFGVTLDLTASPIQPYAVLLVQQ